MLEIPAKVFPAGISFLECEVLPNLFVEKLIDRRVRVHSSSWVAVPIPNATTPDNQHLARLDISLGESLQVSTFLIHLDVESLFKQLMQQSDGSKTCSNDQYVHLLDVQRSHVDGERRVRWVVQGPWREISEL